MSLNKFTNPTLYQPWMSFSMNELTVKELNVDGFKPMVLKFTKITNTTVQNTSLEENLVTTNDGVGSLLLQANSLKVGDTGRLKLSGIFSAVLSASVTFRFFYGPSSNVFASSLSLTPLPITVGAGFELDFNFTVKQLGPSGTGLIQMMTYFKTNQFVNLADYSILESSFDSANFDTTVNNVFAVTVDYGSASPDNSITCNQATFVMS